jgi:hypothetical protein
MNATVEDLRPTIVPKSDQLNAEQLLGGPMTITVSDVRLGSGEEQPVVVHYVGEEGRPFKPCKTMRKVLIHAWGADGRQWLGRSMTLYNDPSVKFGGEDVGGIRISHLTDIPQTVKVSLTSTRGKKAKYEIRKLVSEIAGQLVSIAQSPTLDALKDNFGAAYKAAKTQGDRDQLTAAKDKRKAELTAAPKTTNAATIASYITSIQDASSVDTAGLVLDEARTELGEGDALQQVVEAFEKRERELR